MFIPFGDGGADLVRLRFQACEKFSDSLPQAKEKEEASNMAVVLLMPQKPAGATPDAQVQAAKAIIRDWMSRMAEIGYQKRTLRPYVSVLAYGLSQDQEQAVMEFVTNATVAVTPIFTQGEDEESCIESLQTLVDKVVAAKDKLRRTGSLTVTGNGEGGGKCCTIA